MRDVSRLLRRPWWNEGEGRPRALARILVQTVIWLVWVMVLGALAGTLFGAGEADPASPPLLDPHLLATRAATFISVWIAVRLLDRRSFSDLGFRLSRAWFRDLAFGLCLGAFLVATVFAVELLAGWVTVTGSLATPRPGQPFALVALLPVTTFLVVGVEEELLFRGYHLKSLAEGLRPLVSKAAPVSAALISVTVFGLMHAGNPNASVASTVGVSLFGALFALAYLLTGELAIPVGIHITWNLFQANVFGFPVSGIDFSSLSVLSIEQGGPAPWTGAAFGPEAGLLGGAAAVLGGVLVVAWVRVRSGGVALRTSVAEPPAP